MRPPTPLYQQSTKYGSTRRRFVLGMLSSGAPHLKFRDIEAEYQRLPDSLLVHPSFILYLANHNTGTLSANRQRRTVRVI